MYALTVLPPVEISRHAASPAFDIRFHLLRDGSPVVPPSNDGMAMEL